MAAGAIWTAVYDICLSKIKTVSPILSAAVDKTGVTYWSQTGSARNGNESYDFIFDKGTWMVFSDGQSATSGGNGARCISFYKGNRMNVQIGVGGGDGTYKGGGKTIVETNFAKPIGYGGEKSEQVMAAGGGGGAKSTTYYDDSIADGFSMITDGTFKGWEGNSWAETKSILVDLMGISGALANGTPATQSHGGYRGFEGFYTMLGRNQEYNITEANVYNPNAKCRSGDVTLGGGGGAGYHDGGGGTNARNNDDVDPGGGGSCSPTCYPLHSSDIQNGPHNLDGTRFRNTYATGKVVFYRIDPAVMPGDSQAEQYGVDGYGINGRGVSITPGSLGNERYFPTEAVRHCISSGGAVKEWNNSGIEAKWVYSVRVGGEWEGLAPDGFLSDSEKRHLTSKRQMDKNEVK